MPRARRERRGVYVVTSRGYHTAGGMARQGLEAALGCQRSALGECDEGPDSHAGSPALPSLCSAESRAPAAERRYLNAFIPVIA